MESFEPSFFNNLVLVLDNYFCRRSRMLELKDGNALNEARMLCNLILNHGGKMSADKSIQCDAMKSVLRYEIGGDIKLDDKHFLALHKVFFGREVPISEAEEGRIIFGRARA